MNINRTLLVIAGSMLIALGVAAYQYNMLYRAINPDVPHTNNDAATCGGIAGLSCPDGYTCQYPEIEITDVAGVCVKNEDKKTVQLCEEEDPMFDYDVACRKEAEKIFPGKACATELGTTEYKDFGSCRPCMITCTTK